MGHLEHSCEPGVEVKVAAEFRPWGRRDRRDTVSCVARADLGPVYAQSLEEKLVSFKVSRALHGPW